MPLIAMTVNTRSINIGILMSSNGMLSGNSLSNIRVLQFVTTTNHLYLSNAGKYSHLFNPCNINYSNQKTNINLLYSLQSDAETLLRETHSENSAYQRTFISLKALENPQGLGSLPGVDRDHNKTQCRCRTVFQPDPVLCVSLSYPPPLPHISANLQPE